MFIGFDGFFSVGFKWRLGRNETHWQRKAGSRWVHELGNYSTLRKFTSISGWEMLKLSRWNQKKF